jgi:hypothetical protein
MMRRILLISSLLFSLSCTVKSGTDQSLSDSIDVSTQKAEAFEERLWEEHRGFPTFSTRDLPEQELREVFRAFAAVVPDGAYVLGEKTRIVIEYRYENIRASRTLRNASYTVNWKERDGGKTLYTGTASAVCQFSDAIVAYPPDCNDAKPRLLFAALTGLN